MTKIVNILNKPDEINAQTKKIEIVIPGEIDSLFYMNLLSLNDVATSYSPINILELFHW